MLNWRGILAPSTYVQVTDWRTVSRQLGVIFDLDNTLYRLRSPDGTYLQSTLRAAVMHNACRFVAARLRMSLPEAQQLLAKIALHDNLSLVFEARYGIDRYEWFQNVWDLNPKPHIILGDPGLRQEIGPLAGRSLLLTSGPRIWAMRVLQYLGLADVFGERILTGEPDLRKPSEAVFLHAARLLNRIPSGIVSIGDQNGSDILPAKRLGMRTIIVGPNKADADVHVENATLAIRQVLQWEK